MSSHRHRHRDRSGPNPHRPHDSYALSRAVIHTIENNEPAHRHLGHRLRHDSPHSQLQVRHQRNRDRKRSRQGSEEREGDSSNISRHRHGCSGANRESHTGAGTPHSATLSTAVAPPNSLSASVSHVSASGTNRNAPWPSATTGVADMGVSTSTILDIKLIELVKAITPGQEERHRRMHALRDVRRALASIGLRVDVYGSLCTGLLIPTSDVDCVLSPLSADPHNYKRSEDASRGSQMPPAVERTMRNVVNAQVMTTRERKAAYSAGVRAVAAAVRASRNFCNVLPISHAKVPIVKCEHREADIKVDLSFEMDGLASSAFLCDEFKRKSNALARPLIVLIKTMIANWGLDDPSTGGLGSFPVAIMAIFFLQTEVAARYPSELRGSLAVLLVGFLKFYGCDFDFYRQGIDYAKRSTFPKPATNDLYVVNPVRPGTSCAKAATLYASRVVPCFADAAKALAAVLDARAAEPAVETSLARFFSRSVPECREWPAVRRRAQSYSAGAQHQWDPETRMYTGGVV